MKSIEVRIDDETFMELWAMARRYCTSIEDAARRCIIGWLKNVEAKNDDPMSDPVIRKAVEKLRAIVKAWEEEEDEGG